MAQSQVTGVHRNNTQKSDVVLQGLSGWSYQKWAQRVKTNIILDMCCIKAFPIKSSLQQSILLSCIGHLFSSAGGTFHATTSSKPWEGGSEAVSCTTSSPEKQPRKETQCTEGGSSLCTWATSSLQQLRLLGKGSPKQPGGIPKPGMCLSDSRSDEPVEEGGWGNFHITGLSSRGRHSVNCPNTPRSPALLAPWSGSAAPKAIPIQGSPDTALTVPLTPDL